MKEKKTRETINLTLSVLPETRNKLRELAFLRDQPLSHIVTELVDAAYEKEKNKEVKHGD